MLLSQYERNYLMDKKHIFFDLDGTIINSEKAVLFCVDYAIKKMGIPDVPYDTKLKFLGPPLAQSFMKYCGQNEEEAAKALSFFREMYSTKGVYMATLYDGIADMLKQIFDSGRKIYLATSKPEKFAKMILSDLNIIKYFTFVAGASMDETRVTKIEVLNHALENTGIADMSECIMVGDRCFDVMGAKDAHMDCVGALWGFGDYDELMSAGAVKICKTPSEVAKYICE